MAKLDDALESIRSFLESNLADPWEVATGKTRTDMVFVNDIRLTGIFPKVFLKPVPGEPVKLNWGGGPNYHKMKKTVTILAFYFNQERFKFVTGGHTYENGGSNTSRDLNLFMRGEIERLLLTNRSSLDNVKNLRIGSPSDTVPNGVIFEGSIPITFEYLDIFGTPGG